MLKNGSQQSTKQPTIMPMVLAAFVSILNFLTCKVVNVNTNKEEYKESVADLSLDISLGEGGFPFLL